MQPVVIGIAGGSCSGKTTFSKLIAEMMGPNRCVLLRQDDYYIDIGILRPDCGLPNFDAPETIEFSLLAKHLKALKAGQAVDVPEYDFTTHTRQTTTQHVEPRLLIIVEGILILTQEAVREQLDDSIYIKCSRRLRYSRRKSRDIKKRGRSPRSVRLQFETTVEPSHRKYVSPSKEHAGRVLSQQEYIRGRKKLARKLIEQWTGLKI